MAEIHVEKKKRPVWPWILAILLAAAIIWIIADDDKDEYGEEISTVETEEQVRDEPRDQTMTDQEGQNDAVITYANFIEKNGAEVTKSHEYTHQALTHLSNAIEAVAQQNNATIENKKELDNLKQQADQLMKERSSTKHADIMANAFTSAAEIINNIQKEQFPDLKEEAEEVKKAAEQVKPGVLATNQKDAINNFFDKSANVLEEMHTKKTEVSMN